MKKYCINFLGTINVIAHTKEDAEKWMSINTDLKDCKYFEIEGDVSNYKIKDNKIIKKTNGDLLQEQLAEARAKKLQELAEYDSSPAVNSFTIHGIEMWLSKEERNSLYRLATACKNMGLKTMPLQLPNGTFVEFPPDNVLAMLDELEVYAGASFGVTGNKKIEIEKLDTIENINEYNIPIGYPEKLKF